MIETTVFPGVGDTDLQYICVTLQVLPKPGYPDTSPDFKLLKPRGLDDYRLNEIKSACNEKLLESIGFPVVFDMIEVIREHLTGSNLPSGQCVICLYGFQEGDEFAKTECFHYLHSFCLARHLNASRRNYQEEQDKLPAWLKKTTASTYQALCPVCREPIRDEVELLESALAPAELNNAPDFNLTDDLKELQLRMTTLFLKQKSRGAIIDVEAESGSVISIEPEEEAVRREQKKNGSSRDSSNNGELDNGGDETSPEVEEANECEDENSANFVQSYAQYNNSRSNQQLSKSGNSNSNKPSGVAPTSATSFAPVITQTQRISNDPTNNNYEHYNRRHYRGGRRHQNQHHHHHRHRHDRDRYENQASHSSQQGGQSQQSDQQATAGVQQQGSGKQTKGQASYGSYNR